MAIAMYEAVDRLVNFAGLSNPDLTPALVRDQLVSFC